MTDIKALYQEVILDHNKNPRNYGEICGCNHQAEGHNPLCGDHIKITLNEENNTVNAINFAGIGCAICKASASMMTVIVKDKVKEDILSLIEEFRSMVTGVLDVEKSENHLGRLKVFANIKNLPVRVKCAVLPWHTLYAALNSKLSDQITSVSTESNN